MGNHVYGQNGESRIGTERGIEDRDKMGNPADGQNGE